MVPGLQKVREKMGVELSLVDLRIIKEKIQQKKLSSGRQTEPKRGLRGKENIDKQLTEVPESQGPQRDTRNR